MNSNEVRDAFLKYFESKGHKILPSSSLVPENDPSVLFTTAGMQQFKQYYGAPENAIRDFGNKNITTSQKCVRTGDIDEVGDATHLTFFEMLGNFSFGGYGRREAIEYAHEFITEVLKLPISYVTFYKGEGVVPKDEESRAIWESLGVVDIREDGADVFWGPTGLGGPCGPTTEIYCKNANGDDVEVWNIVFNEYVCDGSREKLDKGEANLTKAETLGIDTGMGFERLLATVQNVKSVYDTDIFADIFSKINEAYGSFQNDKDKRIVADHVRTAVFMICDGVVPSNKDRGYILRRILRRAIIRAKKAEGFTQLFYLVDAIVNLYVKVFPELEEKKRYILEVVKEEELNFGLTVANGLKEFEKGTDPFILATTYGFPIELTLELAEEKGIKVDLEDFNKKMEEHQKLSQTSSAGMFKGGLANHEPQTIKLHTAHHLLLSALQQVLGKDVKQRGSNITEERLRMDFSFDRKMTDEEKKQVEDIVNENIKKGLTVTRCEMPREEAEKIGAEMEFGAKYPDVVSVYYISPSTSSGQSPSTDAQDDAVSIEFCGGPHIANTSELGVFKIQKEEASSQGVRRIKAVLS